MCTVPIWVTRTGVVRPASVPSPSCPESLPPQAPTEALPATTATAESQPAAMAVTWDTPVILTGTALLAVPPLPSWPTLLEPQAHTVPSDRSARLWSQPPATLLTPVRPVTWTGASPAVRGAVAQVAVGVIPPGPGSPVGPHGQGMAVPGSPPGRNPDHVAEGSDVAIPRPVRRGPVAQLTGVV